MYMIKFRRLLTSLSVLLLLPIGMRAETSLRIQRMMEQMPCLPAPTDSFFVCPQIAKDLRFVIEHDGTGSISHLGLSVFTPEVKRLSNPYLCNCVERLLLECLLQADETSRIRLMTADRFKILLNGYPLGHAGFPRFANCLPLFAPSSTMTFQEHENGYSLRIDAANDDFLTIVFPKDRELIFGTDKKEQDELVGRQLELCHEAHLSPIVPEAANLQAVEGGLWLLPGEAYLIDSLRSDLFFVRDGHQIKPVYDASHPEQSLVNLLMGQIVSPDVHLNLAHRRYGLQTPRYRLTMGQLLTAIKEDGARCYAAGRLLKGGTEVMGVLMIHYPSYQYLNIVNMTAPVAELFSPDAVLHANLYTNVPQHNVLELFEERLK